ncbi:MAG: metallophosphoesterase family protein, partial [Candidatus Cryptobacteroides sp.]
DNYSVVIIGDTHFDTAPDTVYHTGYSDPNPTRDANHRKEFVRNAEMWADRCPRLVKRAACLADDNTRLAIQTGDIIQGDTAGVEMHCKMLDDAFTYLKNEFGPIPLVTVVGNHDVRGKSDAEAREAYLKYMPQKMSQELGCEVDDVNFSFRIGEDAYIVVDFNKPDDGTVERLLKETEDARYTFIICHAPLFPYDGGKYSNWFYHGRDKDPQARNKMRALFSRRNVIVLCGHTHSTELLDWYGDGGRITQMTVNSVWRNEQTGIYEVASEGTEGYAKLCEKELFNEYRPGVKRYSRSIAAGSYKLKVSDDGVIVDFYAGDSTRPSASFTLR